MHTRDRRQYMEIYEEEIDRANKGALIKVVVSQGGGGGGKGGCKTSITSERYWSVDIDDYVTNMM